MNIKGSRASTLCVSGIISNVEIINTVPPIISEFNLPILSVIRAKIKVNTISDTQTTGTCNSTEVSLDNPKLCVM